MTQVATYDDDRGAIMLVAVFFATFAIAVLYLAMGAGESVLFREQLQDAADSAALSGAITYARMMNVLVLINLVMSVLLAVLVAIKLVEGIAIVGTAIAAALAWFTAGATLAAIPPLNSLRTTMQEIYQELKDPVFDALVTLNDVADKIVQVAPQVSEFMVQGDLRDDEGEIVAAGFAAPTVEELPVEDDSYEFLCGKAGKMVVNIGRIPFDGIPGMDAIFDTLGAGMETMASSLANWFCSDGTNSLPDLSQNVDRAHPRSTKTVQCENEDPPKRPRGKEKEATSATCDAAEAERKAAEPDEHGDCQTGCGPDGPYDEAVKLARQTCDPSLDPRPFKYRYQLQQMRVVYQWNGKQWVKGEPRLISSQLVEDSDIAAPPCGPRDRSPTVAEGYNPQVHPRDDPTRVLPACSSEAVPELEVPEIPPDLQHYPDPVVVEYRQVSQILRCKRNEKVTIAVANEKSPSDVQKNDKSPKHVASDLTLGSEQFQVRAVVIADSKQQGSARAVRLGLWGRGDPDNPLERLRQYGGFATAQAEYFYDGTEGRLEWMWRMNWRGRLKRFELPSEIQATNALMAVCGRFVPKQDCARVFAIADDFGDLLAH